MSVPEARTERGVFGDKPSLVFACAHLCDERLYAHQVQALAADHDVRVFAFRQHDTLGAMARELLANAPKRFTLIGLSLGGYLAFEVIRQALPRIERLVLMDTRAYADDERRIAGRHADMDKVRSGGIEALIPELPSRWLLSAHQSRADLVELMNSMARSIGAQGQLAQSKAMLARPDSHDDLRKVRVPTLLVCGRQDPVTPLADHETMAACIPGSRLEVIEECGHLSTIEQPQPVTATLAGWLRSGS